MKTSQRIFWVSVIVLLQSVCALADETTEHKAPDQCNCSCEQAEKTTTEGNKTPEAVATTDHDAGSSMPSVRGRIRDL